MLIDSLYKPLSFWERAARHRIVTLALIGDANEAAAIPHIASLLLDRNREVASAALKAIQSLVQTLSPSDLPWLEQIAGQWSPYWRLYPASWTELKPDQVGRLRNLGPAFAIALGLATFHNSGYVRQEALRALVDTDDGSELPYLLLRLNDWVSEVRNAADSMVRARLTKHYASLFVENIALLERLRIAGRGRNQEIVHAIDDFLKSTDGRQAIRAGLDSPDKHTKRACYRLAFDPQRRDRPLVIEKAISDSDPTIRLQGIKESSSSDTEPMTRLLSRARNDRVPSVRREVLRVCSERLTDMAGSWFKQALLDSSPLVRGYAQFELGKRSAFDLRGFYLEAFRAGDSADLYPALAGLGETGSREDVDLVMSQISHDMPRIRRAAVRALAQLHADKFVDVFEYCLSDHSRSVSWEARKGLCRALYLVAGERIWEIFSTEPELHVRRNALFVISKLSKWESISYLVEALGTDVEGLKNLAGQYVTRWQRQFNRSFPSPTRMQIERLSGALDRAPSESTVLIRKQLEWFIAER